MTKPKLSRKPDPDLVKYFNNAAVIEATSNFSKKIFPFLKNELTFANDQVTFIKGVSTRTGYKWSKDNYFLMSYNFFSHLRIPKRKIDYIHDSDFQFIRAHKSSKKDRPLIIIFGASQTPFVILVPEQIIRNIFGDAYKQPRVSLE